MAAETGAVGRQVSPASSKQRSRHSRRPFCLTHHGDDSANGKLGWHLADMLARSRGVPVTVLHLGRPEFVEGIETGPARRAEEAVSGVSETPQIGEPELREARALALVEIERDDAGTYCAPAPVSLARGKGLPAQTAKRSVHSAGLVSPAPDLVRHGHPHRRHALRCLSRRASHQAIRQKQDRKSFL